MATFEIRGRKARYVRFLKSINAKHTMATIDNTVNLVNVGDQSGKSSASARNTALINFDMYLEYIFTKVSCNYPHKSFSMPIPPDFFTKDVIGKFADYLVKVKKIGKCGTALGHISITINTITVIFTFIPNFLIIIIIIIIIKFIFVFPIIEAV